MAEHRITLPLTDDVIAQLHAGDYVYLTGELLTARDAAHKRMCEALRKGEPLPVTSAARSSTTSAQHPRSPAPSSAPPAPPPPSAWTASPSPCSRPGLRAPSARAAAAPLSAKPSRSTGRLLPRRRRRRRAALEADPQRRSRRLRRPRHRGHPPHTRRRLPAIVCNDIYGADALQQGKAQWRREEVLGR